MTTPAERMLELTSLSGLQTPAAHFLSITQGGGGGTQLIPVISGISVIDDLPKVIIAKVDHPVTIKVLLPEE